MRETEVRIKEYKKQLPYLKEKVASFALFLGISIIMMTSATFAWLTISKKPEITGVTTSVTANGNLEVALAEKNGLEPSESMAGDSNLELTLRNLTWGNLVNLSDSSYGLGEIILRPASLNRSSLLEQPLYSAKYSDDGRIEHLTSDFAFANYDIDKKSFLVPLIPQYGVRAISSVTYTFAGGEDYFINAYQSAQNTLNSAKNQYITLTGNSDYMNSISGMMGNFLTDKFADEGTKTNFSEDIPQVYQMMKDLKSCMDTTADTIVQVANIQVLITKGQGATVYTLEELFKATTEELKKDGIEIEGLETFKKNYNTFNNYLAKLTEIYKKVDENGAEVYWEEIDDIVNFLVDINSVEVDGYEVGKIGMSDAASLVLSGNDHKAIIMKGMLLDMEKLLGAYMYAENLKVHVTIKKGISISQDLYADVYTSAKPSRYMDDVIEKIVTTKPNLKGTDPVAADTYGLAIDFWVRTNAPEDYLLLEGNVVTTQVQKTDDKGNLYFKDKEGRVVIKNTKDEFFYEDGTKANNEELTVIYVEKVIGYEGENRVWDDATLSNLSTTQGGGSCYVFYADTPQTQDQSLTLLRAMNVVFVDQEGKLLAEAEMDVDSHYAESGRVTVPLKLRTNSMSPGKDKNGNTLYAITKLKKGEPTRITAIIYLNGEKVDNTQVLEDGNISGRLNLQFGSYSTMEAINDSELKMKEVTLSAKADKTSFDFSDNENLVSKITLQVGGVTPKTVTANIMRQINSTQGSKLDDLVFNKTAEGTYEANQKFEAPGTYVLRSVWLDGVEYELPEEQKITIIVNGFGIASVGWQHSENNQHIMSAESYHKEKITVSVSGSIVPKSAKGVFVNKENQQVIVNLTKGSSGNWTGDAHFTSSGTYKLQHLIFDGEYYEIPPKMQKTLELSLGMKAKVQISQTVLPEFDKPVTVEVNVQVFDNKGTKLNELQDVEIQYVQQGTGTIYSGLHSKLEWNGNTGKYEGQFNVSNPGAFEFSYLIIGDSSINSAEAPVITAIPKEPPAYYGNLTPKTIFAFGKDVNMKVTLTNSSAIANENAVATIQKLKEDGTVLAEIKVKGSQNGHINTEADGNATNLTDWIFKIPSSQELEEKYPDQDISQIGTWKMKELSLIGAYYNGQITTDDNPMTIDLSEKDIQMTIDDEMTIEVTGESKTFEEPKQFMQENTVSEGLSVIVQGAGGIPIDHSQISDVKATYVLDVTRINTTGKINTEGYYYEGNSDTTIKQSMQVGSSQTISLVKDVDSDNYIIDSNNPMTLTLAGTYILESVQFKIGKTTYYASTNSNTTIDGAQKINLSEDSKAPEFTHNWAAPVVKITGVDPGVNQAITINDGDATSAKRGTKYNVFGNYSCTVYLVANFEEKTDCDGKATGEFSFNGYKKASTVTTKIEEYGTFKSATMEIAGDNNLVLTYEYNNQQITCSQPVGTWESTNLLITTIYDRKAFGASKKGEWLKMVGELPDGTEISYVFKLENPISITNTK